MKALDNAGVYLDSGYLNFDYIMSLGYPYTIIVSLRGGGKTFGALDWCLRNEQYFMYFRRNKNALEIVTDPRYHIFKAINRIRDRKIVPALEKGIIGHFTEDEKEIGLAAALSTFGGIRSISAEDITVMIFDEFIPQAEERRTYDLFSAWVHADESITRNRVTDGLPEPRRILLANTDRIHGDILAGYGVIDDFYYMQQHEIEIAEASQDVLLVFPRSEKLAEQKEDTALYRTTRGTEFHDVAIGNRFKIEDQINVKKQPIREYVPQSYIDGICVYRHKSNGSYYITQKVTGSPTVYDNTDADRRRFLRASSALWSAYLRKKVYFNDLKAQNIFLRLYKLI